jgi:hypothetical protein
MKSRPIILMTVLLFGLISYTATQDLPKSDLEKAIQNPIANLVSLPFQNNTDYGIGAYSRTKNTLNMMPVLPFSLGKKINLITRTIIPLITQPMGESDSKTGLGDIMMSSFFSPAKTGALIWGIGPVIGFPTATNDVLGSNKWSAGPALVLLTQPTGWTIGLLAQNTFSFAGDEEAGDVNFLFSQVFIVKNLPKKWYVNSSPIITANWKADQGQQWTVPLGIGGGKLVMLGKLPVNCQAGYYYNIVKPDGGPVGQIRAQMVFILPKFY